MELAISAQSEKNGEVTSSRLNLARAVTLGRGPESPLVLDAAGISREHFRLHSEGDRVFVTDLSSNGAWLNSARLKRDQPALLTAADTLKIPGFVIHIEYPNAPAKLPPATPAEPEQARGALAAVRAFAASFSQTEKFLIALALATLFLVIAYLNS